jgi:exonuclease III
MSHRSADEDDKYWAMIGKSGEVVAMIGWRRLDFSYVQETRWKGRSSMILCKEGQRYTFFWQGCKKGVAGVGVLVDEKWIEKVKVSVRGC